MSRFTRVTEYKGYPLPQTYASMGYAKEILAAGENQLLAALQQHSQVFVVHIMLHFPQMMDISPNTDNSCFQYFIESYVRYLTNRKYDPRYLWVREIGRMNGHLHYHLLGFLNGHSIQFFNMEEIDNANRYWQHAIVRYFGICGQQQVHVASDNFKVFRDSPETFSRAVCEKIAYLSKLPTKENCGPYIRNWGQSLARSIC